MDSIPRLHIAPRIWLLESVLAPHIDAYVEDLKLDEYAGTTINTYVGCIAHFARWTEQCRLELSQIGEDAVARFLAEHLPHCDCPSPVCRTLHDLRPACRHLLRVLRDHEVIVKPEPAPKHDDIEHELRGFDEHMHHVRGLAPKTRRDRLRIVRGLLHERFAEQPLELSALQPDDVRQFVAEQLARPGMLSCARALASALRAYFRYRAACGDHADALTGVIASPAQWSLGSLPRSLTDDEVHRLLESFPSDLPSYRRGYAMVRCALDMDYAVARSLSSHSPISTGKRAR